MRKLTVPVAIGMVNPTLEDVLMIWDEMWSRVMKAAK